MLGEVLCNISSRVSCSSSHRIQRFNQSFLFHIHCLYVFSKNVRNFYTCLNPFVIGIAIDGNCHTFAWLCTFMTHFRFAVSLKRLNKNCLDLKLWHSICLLLYDFLNFSLHSYFILLLLCWLWQSCLGNWKMIIHCNIFLPLKLFTLQ